MSTQIIPFNENTLPAHLAQSGVSSLNDMAAAFASVAFPSVSIKGKVFHINRNDTKTLITRPKVNPTDPTEPASNVEVVILNIQRAKAYYEESYVEGTEAKPTCFSNDGVKPDSSVVAKPSITCDICKFNVWGSGSNDKGEATKGKACSDVQRMAIASPSNLDDAFLMRVPPASLKGLAETAKQLSGRNLPLNGVVMRISFEPTAASPMLVFKPIGYLDSASFIKAQALQNSDLVLAIVGRKGVTAPIVQPATVERVELSGSLGAPVEQVVETAAKKPAAKTKKQLAQEALDAAEAEEGAAPAAAEAFGAPVAETPVQTVQTTATPVVSSNSFDSALNDLLNS